MQDSIFTRANFEEVTLCLSCMVKPGQTEKVYSNLTANQHLCLQEISWKYGVDSAGRDNYGWPKTPLIISISGVTKNRVESPLKISPPRLLSDSVQIEVANPSSIAVNIYFQLKGVVITVKDGFTVSPAEIIGYVLLDDNQKGLLALSDQNSKSTDSILTAFLKHQMFHSPQGQQFALSGSQEAVSSIERLPDEASLLSLMIGDLVTHQAEQPTFSLELSQIRELAKFLVSKKWSR